ILTALKWSGTSVTVGSLVAAITVRVIAGGAAVVCAAAESRSAIAPSNSSPVVLNCMIASQVQRIIGAPYALPAPLGMAGRFEVLLDGNREQADEAVREDNSDSTRVNNVRSQAHRENARLAPYVWVHPDDER